MLLLFNACLALFATAVIAQPRDNGFSEITSRQAAAPAQQNCTQPCATFVAVSKPCNFKDCVCHDRYMEAQGDCLICQSTTPMDAAAVQIFMDEQVQQCRLDGTPIQFRLKLNLDQEAQGIVDKFNRDSAVLRWEQRAFLALQVAGGHVGLVIVLAFAIFSRKVLRDATFLNFCITWIFSSIVYSILLYRGTSGNTLANTLGRVSPNLCLAQASLINGAQVMTAASTLSLVIQLWISLRTAIHGDLTHSPMQKSLILCVLLATPYVLFFSSAVSSVLIGKQHIIIQNTSLESVLPANFYCVVIELRPCYGVTLGLLLIAGIFDALIVVILYRYWMTLRNAQTKSPVSLSLLIRVITFSVYRVTVAVAYATVLKARPQAYEDGSGDSLSFTLSVPIWVDMFQAALPLVGFLVLGTNMDMVRSMMFWRKTENGGFSPVQNFNPKPISSTE